MKLGEMLSDDEFAAYVDHSRDDRFLEFAETIRIGADAIHEKRRLQAELEKMTTDRDKWMDACRQGDAARGSILGDLMSGLASGVLRVDRNVPPPDRFKKIYGE